MEIFRKTMDFFQKISHVFRISWEIIEGTREKGREEKTKTKRKKEYTQRNPRQKQINGKNKKDSTTKTNPRQKQKGINDRTERYPRQKQINGKNKKDSTTKTKRIPHKMGRKEGQFVHKSKDLRSNILMQT